MFPVYGGNFCRVKRFSPSAKHFADDEEVEIEVRKWLRQQSTEFYAAGFDALGNAVVQVYRCWRKICREMFYFALYPFVS
jgi:hypothetical protein